MLVQHASQAGRIVVLGQSLYATRYDCKCVKIAASRVEARVAPFLMFSKRSNTLQRLMYDVIAGFASRSCPFLIRSSRMNLKTEYKDKASLALQVTSQTFFPVMERLEMARGHLNDCNSLCRSLEVKPAARNWLSSRPTSAFQIPQDTNASSPT